MPAPRHKVREVKKKTFFDRLKGSAVFILVMVVLFIVDVVSFIFVLSGILNGSLEGMEIVTYAGTYIFVALAVGFLVFFSVVYWVQRRVHGA